MSRISCSQYENLKAYYKAAQAKRRQVAFPSKNAAVELYLNVKLT